MYNQPFSKSTTMKTKTGTLLNDKMDCRICVTQACSDGTLYVIPMHPSFLGGRLCRISQLFCSYKWLSIKLTTVPKVPVTDAHQIAICHTSRCTPLTNVVANQFASVQSMNSTSGMAWNPLTLTLPQDNLFHPIVPTSPSDIPFTVFVKSTADTVYDQVSVYLDISVQFKDPYSGDELYASSVPSTCILTTDINGTKSNVALYGTVGFVLSSSAPNIDCGELITCTSFAVVATSYADVSPTHNLQLTSPVSQVLDRGVVYMACMYLN